MMGELPGRQPAGCEEPPKSVAAATSASASRAIVRRFNRNGVNHAQRRVPSHERAPVAAAPDVTAANMHCTHIARGS